MSSSATLQTGGVTLDQVGDMVEVKQALTEAVLWPLRYPDSFARLGVEPPRGVLVYGPPAAARPSCCARSPAPASSTCSR